MHLELAQRQVQKAQKSQKKQYDKNTKEPDLKVAERDFRLYAEGESNEGI